MCTLGCAWITVDKTIPKLYVYTHTHTDGCVCACVVPYASNCIIIVDATPSLLSGSYLHPYFGQTFLLSVAVA